MRLLASRKNWIEGEAPSQLRKTAELPGMRLAVGLPYLHPGRGHPVGAAFVTAGGFYPQLVGNDVGCGMSLWQADLARQKFKQDNAWSLAHGAGRRWNRRSAKARLQDRYRADSLVRTEIGSAVICEDKELLYEEAPQAYKSIGIVISDLVEAGLIHVVATLKPLITYKVRRPS